MSTVSIVFYLDKREICSSTGNLQSCRLVVSGVRHESASTEAVADGINHRLDAATDIEAFEDIA